MSHILAENPHLGIANNYVGALEGPTRRTSLLHVPDERGRLKFVPLEIQMASQTGYNAYNLSYINSAL